MAPENIEVTRTPMPHFEAPTTTTGVVEGGRKRTPMPATRGLSDVRATIATESRPKITNGKGEEIKLREPKIKDVAKAELAWAEDMLPEFGLNLAGVLSSLRNGARWVGRVAPQALENIITLKIKGPDAVSMGLMGATRDVLTATNSAGRTYFEGQRKWSMWRENLLPVRLVREIAREAELKLIDILQPPEKRDLSLYIFDVREGVRSWGVDPHNPRNANDWYEKLFTEPHTGPTPKTITGIGEARDKLKGREMTIKACDYALKTLRTNMLDGVWAGGRYRGIAMKGRGGYVPTTEDVKGMYMFINCLGGVDAINIINFLSQRMMSWEVSADGDVLLTSKGMTHVPKGIIELDRSSVTEIQTGTAGSASLKIIDWLGRRGASTYEKVQTWLASRGKTQDTPSFVGGRSYSVGSIRVPEFGQQKY